MSTVWALVISLGLLAANGFFVAAEFALVAAKSHRLERAEANGGVLARAALSAKNELPLMLAGAQLGITLCSLGLGALAEPAIAHLFDPLFVRVGIPDATSYAIAFVVALAIVVFAHMVVGEMAPKSWAITHPEKSATMLAWPFVLFTRAVRPALLALNALANLVLRIVKVRPQGTLPQAHGPDELHVLLRQSREGGLLGAEQHRLLTGGLRIYTTPIRTIMRPHTDVVTVAAEALIDRAETISDATGRSRLIVTDTADAFVGVLHIRDVLKATTNGHPATIAQLMSDPLRIDGGQQIAAAITTMRDARAQIAIVTEKGQDRGLVSLEDLLEQVIGEFEDETDPPDVHRQTGGLA